MSRARREHIIRMKSRSQSRKTLIHHISGWNSSISVICPDTDMPEQHLSPTAFSGIIAQLRRLRSGRNVALKADPQQRGDQDECCYSCTLGDTAEINTLRLQGRLQRCCLASAHDGHGTTHSWSPSRLCVYSNSVRHTLE